MNTQQTYIPSWNIQPLSEQLVDADNAQTTASVIHWRCITGWHNEYVDVKVTHSGALKTETEIVDSVGTVINPATEEGLQDIVTAIENISIPAPVGGATEAKQDINNNLADAIYELVARLDFLPSIRWTLADIRVTSTGGTVGVSSLPTLATVTTVGTVSNQSAVWWIQANQQIPSLVNTTAYLSNINNITFS